MKSYLDSYIWLKYVIPLSPIPLSKCVWEVTERGKSLIISLLSYVIFQEVECVRSAFILIDKWWPLLKRKHNCWCILNTMQIWVCHYHAKNHIGALVMFVRVDQFLRFFWARCFLNSGWPVALTVRHSKITYFISH